MRKNIVTAVMKMKKEFLFCLLLALVFFAFTPPLVQALARLFDGARDAFSLAEAFGRALAGQGEPLRAAFAGS